MSLKHLLENEAGDYLIDIHTGGEDNIFPHHECEIAQTEAATGKKFVGYWLHKRRVNFGDEKMSKSLGKEYFETIRGPGRVSLEQRVERLYERATEFDDDTNYSFSETVAEKATTELFDIRHLSIGKLAPEIEGSDQEGRPIKLSDYQGKVVLLYFWMEY